MRLHFSLIAIGGLFLAALVLDEIGHRTRLPRVTLLLLFGFAIGASGLDLLPQELRAWYQFLSAVALTMVAFLLGGSLSRRTLQAHGKEILVVSLAVVLAAMVIVPLGLFAIGAGSILALLLAGLATATDPAAIRDVVKQTRTDSGFSRMLLGVVAIDDAWGLLAFSFLLIVAKALAGDGGAHIFIHAIRELGLASLLGLGLGLPAAYLTGRLKRNEPLQAEALGIVFLCAGLAMWLQVSFLLTGMIAGSVVANFARHHRRAFHEIEHIEWPFMILFFVLAGATLDIKRLGNAGLIVAAYIVLRIGARFAGGFAAGRFLAMDRKQTFWIGPALLPQAGVAIGMALVAGDHFPHLRETILTIAIATTVFFEVLGPIAAAAAMRRVQ